MKQQLEQLEQAWIKRQKLLAGKVAATKEKCQDESFAAIEELRKGPHGLLLDLLHDEARLSELTQRLKEFKKART